MKLIIPFLVVAGIAFFVTLLTFTTNRPSSVTFNTALTDIDFIRHLAKYGKSYGTMEEFS